MLRDRGDAHHVGEQDEEGQEGDIDVFLDGDLVRTERQFRERVAPPDLETAGEAPAEGA